MLEKLFSYDTSWIKNMYNTFNSVQSYIIEQNLTNYDDKNWAPIFRLMLKMALAYLAKIYGKHFSNFVFAMLLWCWKQFEIIIHIDIIAVYMVQQDSIVRLWFIVYPSNMNLWSSLHHHYIFYDGKYRFLVCLKWKYTISIHFCCLGVSLKCTSPFWTFTTS